MKRLYRRFFVGIAAYFLASICGLLPVYAFCLPIEPHASG
jgi:hypothetical protein